MAVSTLRFVPGKLYGRAQESQWLVDQLHAAAADDAAADDTHVKMIWVSGLSGTGKSALVEQALLRRPTTTTRGGIYATGKWEPAAAVPYAAFTTACVAICQQILPKQQSSDDDDKQQQQKLQLLKDGLGNSIFALAKLIPSILELFKEQPNDDDDNNNETEQEQEHEDTTTTATTTTTTNTLGVNETHHRFLFAMGTFVRIVAHAWGPLVMVLDDIQWADVESLHLLETLCNDPTMTAGLVLVGCFRSNEVDDTHMLRQHMRDMESSNHTNITLDLSELDVDAVKEMLVDVLSLEDANAKQTRALASVVHKKTNGNAFFVIQYLKMMQENGLLDFNLGLMKWVWSLEEIETKTGATENVIDLMRHKMQRLPNGLCEVLPLAACLGATFHTRELSVVIQGFQAQRGYDQDSSGNVGAERWLEICSNEGFIERVDQGTFRWIHDKIQEAALELVVADKLPAVQYRVGELLLQHFEVAEITEFIFVVVNLLNKSIGNTDIKSSNPLRIAKLNLQAGKAAMVSASFGQAARYLQSGIECLPDDHWKTEYELSLELFSAAAEAEYCTGTVASMTEHCNAIIAQSGRPISDKFRAYNVLIPTIGQTDGPAAACDLLVKHLKDLGCTFPTRGQLLHVVAGIMHIKSTLKKYRPEDFTALKMMEDETKIQIMRTLDKLATFAYFLDDSLLVPLAIFKSFRYSLDYGICEYSPATFALVAMILIEKLGVSAKFDLRYHGSSFLTLCTRFLCWQDWQGARTYADHALSMIRSNTDIEAVESRTIFLTHAFSLHRGIPHHMCLKPYLVSIPVVID